MISRQEALDLIQGTNWADYSDEYGPWCKVIPCLGTLDKTEVHRIAVVTDFTVHTFPSSITVFNHTGRDALDFPGYFYSNGGLGCLLGVLAKQHNMSLRPDGLYVNFNHRERKHVSRIPWCEDDYGLVSSFLEDMLCVRHLPETYAFDTEEDMFKMISDSPLFLKKVFLPYKGRLPLFDRFLDYVQKHNLDGNERDFNHARFDPNRDLSICAPVFYQWYLSQMKRLEYRYKRALLKKEYTRQFLKQMKQHDWWLTMMITSDRDTVQRHTELEYRHRLESDTVVT